jgi:hypothetical protein
MREVVAVAMDAIAMGVIVIISVILEDDRSVF